MDRAEPNKLSVCSMPPEGGAFIVKDTSLYDEKRLEFPAKFAVRRNTTSEPGVNVFPGTDSGNAKSVRTCAAVNVLDTGVLAVND